VHGNCFKFLEGWVIFDLSLPKWYS
jgi:hypothetical protein